MKARNFHYSKVLKPLPLFILFALICLALDWLYPSFLSRYSFLIILACGVLFGFLPKQLTLSRKKETPVETTPGEAAPQIFKFKTFFNFQDLIQSAIQETTSLIENLPPSSISIFAHLSSKNQRYPVSLASLVEQIKELSLPVFIHPVLSLPQKKLRFNKLEVFLSVSAKKQTVLIEKLDIKTSPEYRSYIDLAILLSLFRKISEAPQKLQSSPYFCKIPENLSEYPLVLQTFKDIINHPDFPKHLFIFMVSPTILSQNTVLLENLHKDGFQIGMHSDTLPALSLPPFLQVFYIDLPDLRSSLKGLARRQFGQTVQRLTEQPCKVILGDVEDEQILQDILPAQFDFACGPALGAVQIWQNSVKVSS